MKVNLTTCSPFFRAEHFDAEQFRGKEIPIMRIREEDCLSESVFFSLISLGFDAMPYDRTPDEKGKQRKYFCVADRFYIIVEKGEKGFDTSLHYFTAEIRMEDSELSVAISEVDDKAVTEIIHTKHVEFDHSFHDQFNERTVGHSQHRAFKNYTPILINMIESTEFISIEGNQNKIPAAIDNDGRFYLQYNNGYCFLDSGKEAHKNVESGSLLYRRDSEIKNYLEIVEVLKYAHDFYGDFWCVAETILTYPKDAEKIKAKYQVFYERECMSDACYEKQQLLQESRELPYVREDYRLGDGIIHIPVETTNSEISIPIDDFHFIMGGYECFGHLTNKGTSRLRLNSLPMLCSLIEVDRRFKLVFYNTVGFVKSGNRYYAELEFSRQSEFFDSLNMDDLDDSGDYESFMMDKSALACACYLMFRGLIKPVVIAKDALGSNISEE